VKTDCHWQPLNYPANKQAEMKTEPLTKVMDDHIWDVVVKSPKPKHWLTSSQVM